MTNPCEHLKGLTSVDFPAPKTPNACEEYLIEKTHWVALRNAERVAMSAAATHHARIKNGDRSPRVKSTFRHAGD
jgi:hypothetical protein